MAHCENTECGKQDLPKSFVEFDVATRKILCHDCLVALHPGFVRPIEVIDHTQKPKLDYEVSFTSKEGLCARVAFGSTTLSFHAPIELLEKWMG